MTLRTMAFSIRTISITGSVVISILLVAGAFFITSPLARTSIADAGSTEALLKAYAQKDTDADGLTDWQETLYKTDPSNAHSADPTLTDKEAVEKGIIQPAFTSSKPNEEVFEDVPGIDAPPNTLTERFTRKFYSEYMTKRGGAVPTTESLNAFVNDAVEELSRENTEAPRFTVADIKDGGSGREALLTYATLLRSALGSNSPSGDQKDPLERMSDFVNNTKEKDGALPAIQAIGMAYQKTTDALEKIPAPKETEHAHLQLLNAYHTLAKATIAMARMDTDPLLAFISLRQYKDAFTATAEAARSLGKILSVGLPQS